MLLLNSVLNVFRSTVRFPDFFVGEQNILVVAHRDSLRALFGHLEGVEAATVFDGTSQTAPLVYEFGTSLRWHFSHEIPQKHLWYAGSADRHTLDSFY